MPRMSEQQKGGQCKQNGEGEDESHKLWCVCKRVEGAATSVWTSKLCLGF